MIEMNEDDMRQLEEFLRRSGYSSHSSEGDTEDPDMKLRSYVKKFLSLKMNHDITRTMETMECQKKTVSFAGCYRNKYNFNNKVS